MSEKDHGMAASSPPVRKGLPPVSKAKGLAPVSKAKFAQNAARPSTSSVAPSASTTPSQLTAPQPKSSLQIGNASSSRALPSRYTAAPAPSSAPSQASPGSSAKSDADLLDDFDDDPLMAAAIAAQKSGGVKRATPSSAQPPSKDARTASSEASSKAPAPSEQRAVPAQSRFMAVVAQAHKRLASELKQDSSQPPKLPRPSTDGRQPQEDLPKAASASFVSASPEAEKAKVPVAKAAPVGSAASPVNPLVPPPPPPVNVQAAAQKPSSDASEVAPWQKLRSARRSVAVPEPGKPCLNVEQLSEEVSAKLMSLGKWKTDDRTQKKLARLTEHIVTEVDVKEAAEAERRSLAVLKQLTGVLGSERAQEFGAWLTGRLKNLHSNTKSMDITDAKPTEAATQSPDSIPERKIAAEPFPPLPPGIPANTNTTPEQKQEAPQEQKQEAPQEAPQADGTTGDPVGKSSGKGVSESVSVRAEEYWQDEQRGWQSSSWNNKAWEENADPEQAKTTTYSGYFNHPIFGGDQHLVVEAQVNGQGKWAAQGKWTACGQTETIEITWDGNKVRMRDSNTELSGEMVSDGVLKGIVIQLGDASGTFRLVREATTLDNTSTETQPKPRVEVPSWDDWDTPWEEKWEEDNSAPAPKAQEEIAAPPSSNPSTHAPEVVNEQSEKPVDNSSSAADISAVPSTPAPAFMKASSKAKAPSRDEWRPAPKVRAAPLVPAGSSKKADDSINGMQEASGGQEKNASPNGFSKAEGSAEAHEANASPKGFSKGEWSAETHEAKASVKGFSKGEWSAEAHEAKASAKGFSKGEWSAEAQEVNASSKGVSKGEWSAEAQEGNASQKGYFKGEWSGMKGKKQESMDWSEMAASKGSKKGQGEWGKATEDIGMLGKDGQGYQKGEHQIQEASETKGKVMKGSGKDNWNESKGKWQGCSEEAGGKAMGSVSWQGGGTAGLPDLPAWPVGLAKSGAAGEASAKGATPSEHSKGDWQNWSGKGKIDASVSQHGEVAGSNSMSQEDSNSVMSNAGNFNSTQQKGSMQEAPVNLTPQKGMIGDGGTWKGKDAWGISTSCGKGGSPQEVSPLAAWTGKGPLAKSNTDNQSMTSPENVPSRLGEVGMASSSIWKGKGGKEPPGPSQSHMAAGLDVSSFGEAKGDASMTWKGKGSMALNATADVPNGSAQAGPTSASPQGSYGEDSSMSWKGKGFASGEQQPSPSLASAISNSNSGEVVESSQPWKGKGALANDTAGAFGNDIASESYGEGKGDSAMAWKGKGFAKGEAYPSTLGSTFACKGKGSMSSGDAAWWSMDGGKASAGQNGDSASLENLSNAKGEFEAMMWKGKGWSQPPGGKALGMTGKDGGDNAPGMTGKDGTDNSSSGGGQLANLQKAFAAFNAKGKSTRQMTKGNTEGVGSTAPQQQASMTPVDPAAQVSQLASSGSHENYSMNADSSQSGVADSSQAAPQGDPSQQGSFNASVLEKAALLAQGAPEVQQLLRNLQPGQAPGQPSIANAVTNVANSQQESALNPLQSLQLQSQHMQQHQQQVVPASQQQSEQQAQQQQPQSLLQQGQALAEGSQSTTQAQEPTDQQEMMKKRLAQLQYMRMQAQMQAQMRANQQQPSPQQAQGAHMTPEQQQQQQEQMKRQLMQMQLLKMQQAQAQSGPTVQQQNQQSQVSPLSVLLAAQAQTKTQQAQQEEERAKKEMEMVKQKQREMMQQQMMQLQQQEMQQQMMQQQHALKMEVMKQQMIKEQEEMQQEMLKQQQVKQQAMQMMQKELEKQQQQQQMIQQSQEPQQEQRIDQTPDMKALESTLLAALGDACG